MAKGRPREFDTEKALNAALLLFWRQGYEGTSVAALGKAMGINQPSLYAAFGNKQELFKRALARYLQGPASYLPNALKEPTARRVVEKLFTGALEMVMDPHHPDGCLLVQGALASGPGAEPIRNELKLKRAAAEAAVRRRFEFAVQHRDLPADVDAARLARFVITIIWGLSVQAAGGATRTQMKEVTELAMQRWPNANRSPKRTAAPAK